MPNAIVYDYRTGLYYNVNMFSFGKHCDAEPLTASDTAVMQQIMGVDNWTPHAVWVILSDGKVYMASTYWDYGYLYTVTIPYKDSINTARARLRARI